MARRRTSPRRSGGDKNAGRNTLRSTAAMQIKAKNRNQPNYNSFSFIQVVRVRSKHTSYILLSTFQQKTAFSAIYKPQCARFLTFLYILGGLEGLFDFYDPLHLHPWTGRSSRQLSAHQAVLEPPTQSLALSKCRSGASDYGRSMTQSLPLSYWSPEKSYMTSSRTATKIYIAAQYRVN